MSTYQITGTAKLINMEAVDDGAINVVGSVESATGANIEEVKEVPCGERKRRNTETPKSKKLRLRQKRERRQEQTLMQTRGARTMRFKSTSHNSSDFKRSLDTSMSIEHLKSILLQSHWEVFVPA
jgi:hypothetical protein